MREGTVIRPPSKDKGLIYFRHSTVLMVLCLVCLIHVITKYDRCYYKMRRLFYYKMRQIFITKCVRLQNAIVSLQNATVTKKCDDFITKCACYYKMWRLLQNGLVQTCIKMKLHLIMQKYHQFSIIFELTKMIKSIYNRHDI